MGSRTLSSTSRTCGFDGPVSSVLERRSRATRRSGARNSKRSADRRAKRGVRRQARRPFRPLRTLSHSVPPRARLPYPPRDVPGVRCTMIGFERSLPARCARPRPSRGLRDRLRAAWPAAAASRVNVVCSSFSMSSNCPLRTSRAAVLALGRTVSRLASRPAVLERRSVQRVQAC